MNIKIEEIDPTPKADAHKETPRPWRAVHIVPATDGKHLEVTLRETNSSQPERRFIVSEVKAEGFDLKCEPTPEAANEPAENR